MKGSILVAVKYIKKTGKLAIGCDSGKLPWNCKEDLKFFREKTLNNVVVMGRKTFDSIVEAIGKPLKNRINIVLTKNKTLYEERFLKDENVFFFESFENLIENLKLYLSKDIFIIGGTGIYSYFLDNNLVDSIFMNEIRTKSDLGINYDTFFPNLSEKYNIISHIKGKECDFLTYKYFDKINDSVDDVYKNLSKNILENGEEKNDRTGTGTISKFSEHLRINVSDHCPVLTTKWVPWKTCIKEMLWFLRGETDNKILQAQGVHIWDGNTSRDFLDSRGLHNYPEGELGPGYGWQIRRSGAEFPNKTGGVDQLESIEKLLKEDPDSRRIMWNLWVPKDLDKMALVACHNQIQLYVSKRKFLSISVYIRSNDIFLGNPFNIFGYYILLRLLAMRHNYLPYELIINIGDAHIYKNHLEAINQQLSRTSRSSPKLVINSDVITKTWEEITIDDFELFGYHPAPSISGVMAV
jgi:thymidylate synthase